LLATSSGPERTGPHPPPGARPPETRLRPPASPKNWARGGGEGGWNSLRSSRLRRISARRPEWPVALPCPQGKKPGGGASGGCWLAGRALLDSHGARAWRTCSRPVHCLFLASSWIGQAGVRALQCSGAALLSSRRFIIDSASWRVKLEGGSGQGYLRVAKAPLECGSTLPL
jgi:hypothetical protein